MVMDYAERVARLRYGAESGSLVREVTNCIFKHLSEPITVEKMARDLCRGKSRLSTDFKKETGENLGDYIMKRKVEESKHILAYTKPPAVYIVLYLGFSSQSHFSRVFKKYAGSLPMSTDRARDALKSFLSDHFGFSSTFFLRECLQSFDKKGGVGLI